MLDIQLTGIILTLLLSAWFAGAETTFLCFNRALFQTKLHRGVLGSRSVDFLYSNPERFLITTLTGNNLSAVIYSSLIALWFTKHGVSEKFIFIVAPLILLVIGEAIPKAVARQLADRIILFVGMLLFTFRLLLYPVVRSVEYLINKIRKRLNIPIEAVDLVLSRADITSELVRVRHAGHLAENTSKMLDHFFYISERRVRDIMTPRTAVVALSVRDSITEARRTILESGFSKLPCYNETIDDLSGVLVANDLLDNPEDIKEILRPLPLVPESLPIVELVPWMRKHRTKLAGVIDEFGGIEGIVSIDDLAQELVGVIQDEYDYGERDCIRLSRCVYMAAGRAKVSRLSEKIGINLFETKTTSLGGAITQMAGRIPSAGDEFELPAAKIRIIKADPKGVNLIKITLKDQPADQGYS